MQIHDAFGVERGGIEIIRVEPCELPHGVPVVAIQHLKIRMAFTGVALGQGIDIGSLVFRSARR